MTEILKTYATAWDAGTIKSLRITRINGQLTIKVG